MREEQGLAFPWFVPIIREHFVAISENLSIAWFVREEMIHP
jgi:hypothetical protein